MSQEPRTKEEIYDSMISPLIAQVIAICKEHKIANVCAFTLDKEEGLCCITAMTTEAFEPEDRLTAAVDALYRNENRRPLMITTRDGDGNVKRVDAIL